MIVVVTEDFEVYHGVVNELRDRGVAFTTVEPGDDLPEATEAVVVGPGEDPPEGLDPGTEVVRADPDAPRKGVEATLAALRAGGGRTVVGIDPGERPGVAVLSGEVVIAAFSVPAEDVADVVRREIEEAVDPLVRIGDGARLVGARIIDELDVPVELVDETGTTPYLGTGARGMGDVLAAVNIARLEGELVENRAVEPTAGEIQAIKNRSRERSETGRTIDAALARRVALGDLTLGEALAEHRDDGGAGANPDADSGADADADGDVDGGGDEE